MTKYFDKKIFYLLLQPMKMDPRFISTLLTLLGATLTCVAAPDPPPPQVPPTPPGLPIDGSLVVLFVIALVYGLYKVYQDKKTLSSKAVE